MKDNYELSDRLFIQTWLWIVLLIANLSLQLSVDQMTIQEQSNQIEELQLEKEQLKEQLAALQSQVGRCVWFVLLHTLIYNFNSIWKRYSVRSYRNYCARKIPAPFFSG